MNRRRNLFLAGGSVLIAFGAGQYLQSGSAQSAAALRPLPAAGSFARTGEPPPSAAAPVAVAQADDRLPPVTEAGTAAPAYVNASQPPFSSERLAASAKDSADTAQAPSSFTAPKGLGVAAPDDHPSATLLASASAVASANGTSSDTDPIAPARVSAVTGAVAGRTASVSLDTHALPVVTRDSLSPATLSPAGAADITLASATITDARAGSPAPDGSTATPAAFAESDPTTQPDPAASSDSCPVTLDLFADRDATLALTLTAPCRPNEGVVLRHAGMTVTYQTTATGSLFLDVPALDAAGDVSLRFPDGTEVTATAPVPELATLRRFALQWVDGDSFALVTDAPVTTLGTAATVLPMFAQVVTLPDPAAPLSIETEVTDRTCGREALGAAFYSEGGRVYSSDLALAMPDCDGAGGYVVLNNPVADMKLAAAE